MLREVENGARGTGEERALVGDYAWVRAQGVGNSLVAGAVYEDVQGSCSPLPLGAILEATDDLAKERSSACRIRRPSTAHRLGLKCTHDQ